MRTARLSQMSTAPRDAGRGRMVMLTACLALAALTGCDRRPGDPPKPTTMITETPATAGLASLSETPQRVNAAISPASDPPPTPIPQTPQPPASTASS